MWSFSKAFGFSLVLLSSISGITHSKSEDEGELKFNYEATNDKAEFQGPAILKLSATSGQNPVLNKPFTIRLECIPLIDAPNSTMRLLLIPEWVEIISGDTIWSGDLEKDQKGILEVVIKPTKKKQFTVFARAGYSQHYKRLLGYTVLSFYLMSKVEEEIEDLKNDIKDLKKALKEVEKGNVGYSKELYNSVLELRMEPPDTLIPIPESIVDRPGGSMGVKKGSEAVLTKEQKKIVELEKLRREYRRLIGELSKKVSPRGIKRQLQHP